MTIRDIKKLDKLESTAKTPGQKVTAELTPAPNIMIHYPKPIFLSEVLPDVANWSELNFVLDPALNRELQIFAPRKLHREEAFHLFVKSLEAIGLRVLQLEGKVMKIVAGSFTPRES